MEVDAVEFASGSGGESPRWSHGTSFASATRLLPQATGRWSTENSGSEQFATQGLFTRPAVASASAKLAIGGQRRMQQERLLWKKVQCVQAKVDAQRLQQARRFRTCTQLPSC